MTAQTEGRLTDMFPDGPIRRRRYEVANAVQIYKGTLVALNTTTGKLHPAADSADYSVVGVAIEDVLGTTGPATETDVLLGIFRFGATNIAETSKGRMMYVVFDNEFDEAVGTNGVKAGFLYKVESGTDGWIVVDGVSRGQCAVEAAADGTYSSNEQDLLNELRDLSRNY